MARLVARRFAAMVVAASFGAPLQAVAAPPPPDAKVDPSAADIDEAKRLFDKGWALYKEKSYEPAIAAFRRAFALSGEPNCLFNISLAYDKLNDLEGAIEYLEYFRVYTKDTDMSTVDEMLDDLKSRKSDEEEDARLAALIEEQQAELPPEPPPETPPPPKEKLFGPGAIAATAIAAVGLGVGIGLGVTSQRRKNEADDACGMDPDGDRFCRGQAVEPLNDSRRFALGADIAFGIGAAAAVTAVILVAVRASRNKKAQSALVPGRRGAALVVHF